MRRFMMGVLAATIAAAGFGVAAQETALPSGESVLDAYVEATGGKAAYEAIRNRMISGRLEIPAVGIVLDMTQYQTAGGRYYTLASSPDLGAVESGSDGETVWTINPFEGGPRVLEGEERSVERRANAIDADVAWQAWYSEVKCVGEAEVNGEACWKLELTPKEGTAKETRYYGKSSKLLVKTELSLTTLNGVLDVEVFMSKYEEADGVKQPREIRQVIANAGLEVTVTVSNIRTNIDIPDDRFAIPEEIKAMVD